MISKSLLTSNNNDWRTPCVLFDELNNEFHFTLDPCASRENAKCKKYFTILENELVQTWENEIVFMNPPYGKEIKKWIEKAYYESCHATIVCLIPARTDTNYWHNFIFGKADDIRFLRGRLYFYRDGQSGRAPFPSAIVIYQNKQNK